MDRGRFCVVSPIYYMDFLLLHEFLQLKETHTLLQVTSVILLDMSTSDAPEVADAITHVLGSYACTLETRYSDFDSVFSSHSIKEKTWFSCRNLSIQNLTILKQREPLGVLAMGWRYLAALDNALPSIHSEGHMNALLADRTHPGWLLEFCVCL